MKKKYFSIIKMSLVVIAVCFFAACNDTIENQSNRDSKGVSVIPNPMTVGEPVTISGPGFKDATAVEFPGGVTVTDFTRAGDFQITMNVPSGTNETGNITVILPSENFVIPIEVMIVSPGVTRATGMDVNPGNGLFWVGPNDKLEIQGQGFMAVQSVVLPGVTLDAMNIRKSDTSIEITIPMGVERRVAKVQLILHDGSSLYTVNEIDFSGEGYVAPELLLLCGRSFKVWEWDEEAPNPFGNGGYNTHKAPEWWKVNYAGLDGQFGQQAGGAKMYFHLPNIMKVVYRDGTEITGKFKVDVTQGVGTWSMGKFMVTAGSEELSALGGTRGTYHGQATGTFTPYIPKIFDVVVLTNSELVLALQYIPEPGSANFYMYRVSEEEGEGSGGGKITIPDLLEPFVGEGSKTWVWNKDDGPCYGMFDGVKVDGGQYWWVSDDVFSSAEGAGASMVFSYQGKGSETLTKIKTDGSTEEGSFAIDMDARRPGWSRAIGKLTTNGVTVLSGRNTKDPREDVYEYWILNMSDTELLLGSDLDSGEDWDYDKEGWGQATFWLFKPE